MTTRGVEALSLGQKQELFAQLLGRLLTWIYTHETWKVRLGEGYVGDTDAKDGDYDGPHMRNGEHYNKLAQDLNLFVKGVFITGAHPAWDEIGAKWKSFHPLCRWGGDFASRDFNHISLTHGGKSVRA